MIPSERIKELAIQNWRKGIDPGFYQLRKPQLHDYINAIIQFLDEQPVCKMKIENIGPDFDEDFRTPDQEK